VPLYGIYSGFELVENEPANDTTTEYRHSEKYEIKHRDFDQPHSLAPLIRTVNGIRRRHPDVWSLPDVRFHHSDDERFLVYSRGHADRDLLLCVVLLDTAAHETTVRLDLGAVGLPADHPYTLHDELGGDTYAWGGSSAYVRLDPPAGQVAHLFHVIR
jgi:starch synthase (maltosyl-transferring)